MENPKFYQDVQDYLKDNSHVLSVNAINYAFANSGASKEEWEQLTPSLLCKVLDGLYITFMRAFINPVNPVSNES